MPDLEKNDLIFFFFSEKFHRAEKQLYIVFQNSAKSMSLPWLTE